MSQSKKIVAYAERKVLDRLIALSPRDAELRLRLAKLLIRSGDSQEALEQIRAVIRLDPNNLPARELRLAVDPKHVARIQTEAESLGHS